jgi:hypothetical protein
LEGEWRWRQQNPILLWTPYKCLHSQLSTLQDIRSEQQDNRRRELLAGKQNMAPPKKAKMVYLVIGWNSTEAIMYISSSSATSYARWNFLLLLLPLQCHWIVFKNKFYLSSFIIIKIDICKKKNQFKFLKYIYISTLTIYDINLLNLET